MEGNVRTISNRIASAAFEFRAQHEIDFLYPGPRAGREAALASLGRGLVLRRKALVTAFRSDDRELVVRHSRILMEAYEEAADCWAGHGNSILPNTLKAIESRAESHAKSADFYGKAARIADNLGFTEDFFAYLELQVKMLEKTAGAYIARGPNFTGKAIDYMEKAIAVAKKIWQALPDPCNVPSYSSYIKSDVERMERTLKNYKKILETSTIQRA